MSRETIVAKRYAKALFDVAQGNGQVALVEEELRSIVDVLNGNADFRKLLEHPNIDVSVKQNLLKTAFEGKVSGSVLNTLQLLVERRRETILPMLLASYASIANESLGQADAIVKTPLPLTEQEKQDVAEHSGKLTGKKIRVENRIDSSLLGGMQVRIGDRLYDGSLSGKLARLQQSLNANQAL
jgi:F-type H+-transporting ATPase subunit delta